MEAGNGLNGNASGVPLVIMRTEEASRSTRQRSRASHTWYLATRRTLTARARRTHETWREVRPHRGGPELIRIVRRRIALRPKSVVRSRTRAAAHRHMEPGDSYPACRRRCS